MNDARHAVLVESGGHEQHQLLHPLWDDRRGHAGGEPAPAHPEQVELLDPQPVDRLDRPPAERVVLVVHADRRALHRLAGQVEADQAVAGHERGEFGLLRALTARRSYFEASLSLVNSQVALRQADVLITGLLLSDGLTAPPDTEAANPLDTGLRDQALTGE